MVSGSAHEQPLQHSLGLTIQLPGMFPPSQKGVWSYCYCYLCHPVNSLIGNYPIYTPCRCKQHGACTLKPLKLHRLPHEPLRLGVPQAHSGCIKGNISLSFCQIHPMLMFARSHLKCSKLSHASAHPLSDASFQASSSLSGAGIRWLVMWNIKPWSRHSMRESGISKSGMTRLMAVHPQHISYVLVCHYSIVAQLQIPLILDSSPWSHCQGLILPVQMEQWVVCCWYGAARRSSKWLYWMCSMYWLYLVWSISYHLNASQF